jgi:predicted ATPase/class 3 adenylate cyclase
MPGLPTGTVTFLFTDIEGSTRLAQAHPIEWEESRQRHDAILREAFEAHHGYIFQVIGDAFCIAFHNASDALAATLAAQSALQSAFNNPESIILRVRMGLHTGEAEVHAGGYQGYLTLSRTQRLMSAASGGQVLISSASEALLRDRLPAGITLRDLGALELKDFPRAENVYQVVSPDLPEQFPPLKSLRVVPNNLPVQLTSFIGREREAADVKRLQTTTRLLPLTSSGGTGKTRLSLAVAAELSDIYPDGIWLVELAPLTDPSLVPQTIASALHLHEEPDRAILATLTDYLRDKQLLLVLDNCEHLIAACAGLADALLHAAPQLQLLASSREALGIAGEATYHVPSLPIPNPNDPLTELVKYDSVRLFVERAVAAKSSFAITNANAAAVAQICYRLDGIPLAIELAAARIKAFTPQQVANRLDDRFRLLTGGSRTALPRQQTLRALIDWSHGLLSEPERVLLRRLSVFAGGWTLEAAEAVCADDVGADGRPPLSNDVLDLLSRLVDKSLVVAEEENGESRYRMLETIRQYAREKLLDSGEGDAVHDRHLQFFAAFAGEARVKLIGAEQERWLERTEAEHDNLRAAMEWSSQRPDLALRLKLPTAMYLFWHIHGYQHEGLAVLRQPWRTQPTSRGQSRWRWHV